MLQLTNVPRTRRIQYMYRRKCPDSGNGEQSTREGNKGTRMEDGANKQVEENRTSEEKRLEDAKMSFFGSDTSLLDGCF